MFHSNRRIIVIKKRIFAVVGTALLTVGATSAFAQFGSPPPPVWQTLQLEGEVPDAVALAIFGGGPQAKRASLKGGSRSALGSQAPGFERVRITVEGGGYGRPAQALVTFTEEGVQSTAPAKLFKIQGSQIPALIRPLHVSIEDLDAPAVTFYRLDLGEARLFLVGVPENDEAVARSRDALVPAIFGLTALDVRDAGIELFGSLRQ